LKVAYSINARLGGGGIGTVAYNAVAGIVRAGALTCAYASSNVSDIPTGFVRHWGIAGRAAKYLGAKDRSGLIYYLESNLFDAWVAARLPRANIFHGWSGMCLRSLRQAKRLGMKTIVERASSHPFTQMQLLREEYTRWSIPLSLPRWNHRRVMQELEETDYVTTPSAFARQSLIIAGIPQHKLVEIPFGVDFSRFQAAVHIALRPFRAIFAGQVSIRKGVPYLLEAWRRLDWRDAELWIVGSIAPDFAPLRHRWSGIAGVRYIAYSERLAELFQISDLFVFPSIEEGSALVTYEAMACGLPIIATPNSGSVARDGLDGFMVPIRDVDALRDRMQLLKDDARLRLRMGQSARARAESFTWSRYQSSLMEYYKRFAGM